MNTAVLPDGVSYNIPESDIAFFIDLAKRMKWQIVDKAKKIAQPSCTESWVDDFAGKWQDNRSTSQIIQDIHTARTSNPEVSL